MKKIISTLLLVLMMANLNVFASDLEYTALYVGSNKAFVNDAEQQRLIGDVPVSVNWGRVNWGRGLIGDVPVSATFY